MNEAVLSAIEEHALTPGAVEAAVIAMPSGVSAEVARSLDRELKVLDEKIERLTDAVANGGGSVPSLIAKLKDLDDRKATLVEEIAAQRRRDRLTQWRRHLRGRRAAQYWIGRCRIGFCSGRPGRTRRTLGSGRPWPTSSRAR
jgi:hypothetical protein